MRELGALDNLEAFLPDPGISPIQIAKIKGRIRQRASRPRRITEEERKEDAGW